MTDAIRTASLDKRFEEIKRGGNHMVPLWRDLASFYLPTRPRFVDSDPDNKGSKGNPLIIDNTGTQALNIARSGMLTGMANPASKWFEQATVRPELNDDKDIQVWLGRVRDIELAIFDRSNTYSALSAIWRDELVFGTGAAIIVPDADNVIRTEVFPIGAYWIAQDERGNVDTICREFTMSLRQMVIEYGFDNLSQGSQNIYRMGQRETKMTVRHLIAPNAGVRRNAVGPKGFAWHDIYWEKTGGSANSEDEDTWTSGLGKGPGDGLLRLGGWNEFPCVVPRWDRNDEEPWGIRCPGIDALGDVMELQTERRVYQNGRAKMVNPPIVGGPGLESRPVSMVAGGITIDTDMAGGGTGAKELHEQRLPLNELREDMAEVRDRINATFLVPVFLKLLTDTRREVDTAEGIRAMERERATMLGPIQEQQADQLLDPFIDRVTKMLIRQSLPFWERKQDGILPLPPEKLIKEPLRIRYRSEVAQQQQMVNVGGIERHAQFIASYAPLTPDIMDTVNWDQIASAHGKAVGLPPNIPRTEEEMAAVRMERMRAQQAAQLQEQMPGMAKGLKDLSETKTGQGSALDALASAQAG